VCLLVALVYFSPMTGYRAWILPLVLGCEDISQNITKYFTLLNLAEFNSRARSGNKQTVNVCATCAQCVLVLAAWFDDFLRIYNR